LRKHGKSDFTIIAQRGRILIHRPRMRDSQTGKTMMPSAIVWGTSQNRHVTRQVVAAACDAVMAQLMLLGLFLGKRLEVISDGARGIGDWVGGIKDVEVEHVLCWYHLCKRIDEGLGTVGLAKEKRKLLEQDILGHLWCGETAQAV
jgi:hypothetical protein